MKRVVKFLPEKKDFLLAEILNAQIFDYKLSTFLTNQNFKYAKF